MDVELGGTHSQICSLMRRGGGWSDRDPRFFTRQVAVSLLGVLYLRSQYGEMVLSVLLVGGKRKKDTVSALDLLDRLRVLAFFWRRCSGVLPIRPSDLLTLLAFKP